LYSKEQVIKEDKDMREHLKDKYKPFDEELYKQEDG